MNRIKYLVGSRDILEAQGKLPVKLPFSEDVMEFFNDVSRDLMQNPASKVYSDVITFAFWIRRANLQKLKERFAVSDGNLHMGRGFVFHIAPSNVPVNFAYSFAAGLLFGNANAVRVPSKDFSQIGIIAGSINKMLEKHTSLKPYVVFMRYERDGEINDYLSANADVRIVWGGDNTIEELCKSALPPRGIEINFADRYSVAVIDSDAYLNIKDKQKTAQDFYNDTYFSDQNACTSPRIVVWTGAEKEKAKNEFWEYEHKLVKEKYLLQDVIAVNKLISACLAGVSIDGAKLMPHEDNLIVRVQVPKLSSELMGLKDNSGYFFEYDCDDITELKDLCGNKSCQTLSYLGDVKMLEALACSGIKGTDRIVPVGKTMDFDLIWDGYDLAGMLSRTIVVEKVREGSN